MKAVVRTCPCANFLNHLDFRLLIFGSHSLNQDEFTSKFFSRRKFIFLVYEKAVWILSLCEFSWSFGLQPWCTGSILFKEANFSPHQWRQLLELALVLISLTIWISDCLSLAHIVKIRMNSLSVWFRDGGSSSYFFKKAVLILSLCKFSWSFGLQSWCIGSFLFKAANFTPINEGSC